MGAEWTNERLEILALLRASHEDLGELYQQAVDALPVPTMSRARLMVTGHCVRELCASLPHVLGDPVAPRSDVNRAAYELFNVWPADELTPGSDSLDTEHRSVSAEMYRAARAVASAAATGNRNSKELTALLATGQLGDLNAAPIVRLHKAIEFFRYWTHRTDYSKPLRTLPTVEKSEAELRIIESAVLTRLGNIADRARVLREALAKANRRTTGGEA